MAASGTTIIGPAVTAGLKIESDTLNGPAAVGAGNGTYLSSVSMTPPRAVREVRGAGGRRAIDPAGGALEGALTFEPHYGDIVPWLCALGLSAGGYSPVSLGDSSYDHYIEPGAIRDRREAMFNDLTGSPATVFSRATLIYGDTNYVVQYQGLNFYGFQLTAGFSGARVSFPCSARHARVNPTENPDITAVTLTPSGRVDIKGAKVYLRPLEGVKWAASKTFKVSDTGGAVSVTIPAGTYSYQRLARFLSEELTRESGEVVYTVTYHGGSRRFMIHTNDTTTVDATGTAAADMGFTANSTNKLVHRAQAPAYFNASGFTNADLISVEELTLTYNGGASQRPERGRPHYSGGPVPGVPTYTLSLTLPRFGGDYLLEEGGAFGLYQAKILFTGGELGVTAAYNEELELTLPAMTLTGGGGEASAGRIVRPVITFEGSRPGGIFNPSILPAYLWRQSQRTVGSGSLFSCVGYYKGRVVIGGRDTGAAEFVRSVNPSGLLTLSYDKADLPMSLAEYRGKLYASADAGNVYEYNGSGWATSYAGVSNYFTRMIVSGDKLYGLEKSTGYLKSYNGSGWTLENIFTGATLGYDLVDYQGYIYCLVEVSEAAQLWRFIPGTGATLIHNFAAPETYGRLTVHDGKIYAIAGTALLAYDGNKQVLEADYAAAWICSYNGHLVIFPTDDSGIYYYDFDNSQYVTFPGDLPAPVYNHGILADGMMVTPNNTHVFAYAGTPLILARFRNAISTNPQ